MGLESINNPLTLDSLKQEFQDVFQELGKFPDAYHIETKPEFQPVIQPLHRLHARLRQKFDQMENIAVICKLDCPTEWLDSLVVVEKNGDLRICLDPINPKPCNKTRSNFRY